MIVAAVGIKMGIIIGFTGATKGKVILTGMKNEIPRNQ